MATSAPDSYLPLSPAVFHILLALAEDDAHGYAIMRDIEERTRGVIKVGPGMLYGSIKWLLEEGLIKESPRRSPTKEDERRKYYRLTPEGLAVIKAEAIRLDSAVSLARSRKVLGRRT
jgi:DNA-binding PadR family transcriptional regulator